ncbi:hypothetical protein T09_12945 [Trichinella sp. T9]|nr:hypothetical protein T09_12945 [Trichinella sp. T9]
MVLLLLLLLVLVMAVGIAAECPSALVWKNIYYIDDTQSIGLQLCCNISTLWAAQIEHDWHPVLPPALDDVSINHLEVPGFDMLLSRCNNETRIGVAHRRDCVTEVGKVLSLEPSHHLPFDQWYVMCFDNIGEPRCPRLCSLEKLCTNEIRCRNVWIQRQIVNVTSTSMTLILHIGQLPFRAHLETEVRDVSSAAQSAEQQQSGSLLFINSETVHANSQVVYQVHGLRPGSWYRLATCTRIPTPAQLNEIRLPPENVVCLDQEIVRTSSNGLSKHARAGAMAHCSLCKSPFVVLLLFGLISLSFFSNVHH